MASPLLVVPVVLCTLACQPAEIRVHDGDTIRIGDERIRLLGLDTPEWGDLAKCRREREAAEAARVRLAALLGAGRVTIERTGHDRYERTLATVSVDGRDVAATLIGEGLARPYEGGRRKGWCERPTGR